MAEEIKAVILRRTVDDVADLLSGTLALRNFQWGMATLQDMLVARDDEGIFHFFLGENGITDMIAEAAFARAPKTLVSALPSDDPTGTLRLVTGGGLYVKEISGWEEVGVLSYADQSSIAGAGSAGDPFRVLAIAQSKVTGLADALAAKAPLASPAFTGTPTAPTPATGDDSTTLATTAFVKSLGYASLALSSTTANTVPYIDASKLLVSSAVTPTELGRLTGVTEAIATSLANRVLRTRAIDGNGTTANMWVLLATITTIGHDNGGGVTLNISCAYGYAEIKLHLLSGASGQMSISSYSVNKVVKKSYKTRDSYAYKISGTSLEVYLITSVQYDSFTVQNAWCDGSFTCTISSTKLTTDPGVTVLNVDGNNIEGERELLLPHSISDGTHKNLLTIGELGGTGGGTWARNRMSGSSFDGWEWSVLNNSVAARLTASGTFTTNTVVADVVKATFKMSGIYYALDTGGTISDSLQYFVNTATYTQHRTWTLPTPYAGYPLSISNNGPSTAYDLIITPPSGVTLQYGITNMHLIGGAATGIKGVQLLGISDTLWAIISEYRT